MELLIELFVHLLGFGVEEWVGDDPAQTPPAQVQPAEPAQAAPRAFN